MPRSDKRDHRVVVGNIGTVYEGTNGFEAKAAYNTYVGKSKREEGRAAGESVTHFIDEEINKEYIGALDLRECD